MSRLREKVGVAYGWAVITVCVVCVHPEVPAAKKKKRRALSDDDEEEED